MEVYLDSLISEAWNSIVDAHSGKDPISTSIPPIKPESNIIPTDHQCFVTLIFFSHNQMQTP